WGTGGGVTAFIPAPVGRWAGFMGSGKPSGGLGPASYAFMMFSMASCLPLFFLGPIAYKLGLSLEQALAAALAGNLVVAVAMALNGYPGVAEGLDFPRQAARVYGGPGSKLVVALRGLVGALWFGVEAYNGALALVMIALLALGHGPEGLVDAATPLVPLALAAYLASMLAVLRRGMGHAGRAASLAGPLMLLYFAWLALWLHHQRPAPGAPTPPGVPWGSAAFLGYLAVQTNWWATVAVNMSDLTRVARDWRSVWLGVLAGMVGGQVLGTYLGYQLAAMTGVSLPQEVIARYAPGAAAVLLGLLFAFLAPWTTDLTANVPALTDILTGALGAPWRIAAPAAVAAGFLLAPWWALGRAQEIVGYVSSFASSYGVILGPILGPMLAHQWLTRHPPRTGDPPGAPALLAMLAGIAASYASAPLLGLSEAHLGGLVVPFPSGPTWYLGVAVSLAAYPPLLKAYTRGSKHTRKMGENH
ncbi:MAG: cytosine permease, partial [Desulfurococcales archaeon]|nr:cytosine permease [Desulfurococcales archaeon]